MSGRTGGDLAQVAELRNGLGHRSWDVAGEADAVAAALRSFRAGSSEFVPSLPPHGVRGAELAERIDDLARRVEATRDAMVAADQWVGTRVARWLHDRWQDVQDAEAAAHGSVAAWSALRRGVLDADHPVAWGHAALQQNIATHGRRLDKVEVDPIRHALNAENRHIRARLDRIDDIVDPYFEGATAGGMWRDTIADIRRLGDRGPSVPLDDAAAGRLRRTVARFSGSRAGAVIRIGGRALGVVGVVGGAYEAFEGVREGDTEQVVTAGLSTIAGAAMMAPFPPAQVAGALVTGGLLVYEYHDEIAAGARAVGRGVAAGARTVGAMAGAAASFVGGLF